MDKPNIVLVFLDNFGWGEPGFNGGGFIRALRTPHVLSRSHVEYHQSNKRGQNKLGYI